jgi:hypothetical protein
MARDLWDILYDTEFYQWVTDAANLIILTIFCAVIFQVCIQLLAILIYANYITFITHENTIEIYLL